MKNKKILIIGLIILIAIIVITCILIFKNNKKNVYIGGQKVDIIDSGDGLYADEYEKGRFIYKGVNPNNYITFNNETWRILSVEKDKSIKIIRNEIVENKAFDSLDARDGSSIDNFKASCDIKNASESTGIPSEQVKELYCEKDIEGCNAWSATDNMVGKPNKFKNGQVEGSVSKDSEMLTYLNQKYTNNKHVVNGIWNIGGTTVDSNLKTQIKSINQFKWEGKAGLITISDYLKANAGKKCNSINNVNSNYTECSQNNWLYIPNEKWWTLTPYSDTTIMLWYIGEAGFIDNNSTINSYGVRPVVYLSKDIKLTGNGTKQNPFILAS